MALDNVIRGVGSGTGAEVAGTNQLKVIQETNAAVNPGNVGDSASFSEADQGLVTGVRQIFSPEADNDYRLRVSQDVFLDDEVFNYAAQNTGKHQYLTTTMTATWGTGNVLILNGGNSSATSVGCSVSTYATFPIFSTATTSFDAVMNWPNPVTSGAISEFGIGLPSTVLVAPSDGVFFRITASGIMGVVSYAGNESNSGIFPISSTNASPFTYNVGKYYQFIAYCTEVSAEFWINDGTGAVKYGTVPLPAGTGRMTLATAGQAFFKQRNTSSTGIVYLTYVKSYAVRQGGSNIMSTLGELSARLAGSYQGLSGGTMGGLATYVNSTNPTAAAPSNTALTANLPGGLGGQGAVTAAAAAATDGIWSEYGVPAAATTNNTKRLKVTGVRLDAVNLGAAVATTATTIQFCLAFGHTAVSLATAEAAAAKAPRRIALGMMNWPLAAAIGQGPDKGPIQIDFSNGPIYVNPGERIALVGKFLAGTATASQVINFTYTPIYTWE